MTALTPEDEAEITKALDELYGDMKGVHSFATDERTTARMMFTMAFCGTTNADKIAKLTGINRDYCRLRCKRLRENGVIQNHKLHVEWADEQNGTVAFICDVLVAEGLIRRTLGTKDEC